MKNRSLLGLILFFIMYAHANKPEMEVKAPLQSNGVSPYHPSYENDVRLIARQHAHKLIQFYSENRGDQGFHEQFDAGILQELKHGNSLVYLEAKKPVGFITYACGQRWNRKFFNVLFNADSPSALGAINFLAVDNAYQGKGYGRALMQSALDDLKKNAYGVKLVTIQDRMGQLASFYQRFGFAPLRTSKFSDWATSYMKSFGPNPWLGLLKKIITKR